MTIEIHPKQNLPFKRDAAELQPFMRQASDGTYEAVVPLDHSSQLVLPYSFSSAEEGLCWLKSPKGHARIKQALANFE